MQLQQQAFKGQWQYSKVKMSILDQLFLTVWGHYDSRASSSALSFRSSELSQSI